MRLNYSFHVWRELTFILPWQKAHHLAVLSSCQPTLACRALLLPNHKECLNKHPFSLLPRNVIKPGTSAVGLKVYCNRKWVAFMSKYNISLMHFHWKQAVWLLDNSSWHQMIWKMYGDSHRHMLRHRWLLQHLKSNKLQRTAAMLLTDTSLQVCSY